MFVSVSVFAQVITGSQSYTQTNIAGINVNNAEITVLNPSGFAIGDRILLIQIQGAVVSTSNNNSFGDISDYNGAGNYEIATICGISGNDFTFDNELLFDYDPNALVQVIKIPQYSNLTITGTITAPAWDGVQGGILVLEAVSIDLLGDIDMDQKGFRGGTAQNSTLGCSWLNVQTAYSYNNPGSGGAKGEGIAVMTAGQGYGKGAAANGGGGGHDHNAGGAGGGNISAGGQGGTNGDSGLFDCKGNHPGVGGKSQTTTDRIFMGGGGGAGHGNNNIATSGGNGGGIIILIAQTLTGNNVTMSTNGETALNTSYDANDPGGDAAGGGGSGGSVHLDIPSVTGNITIEAIGGNGGDVVHTEGTNDCFGPGGGGAGGTVKFHGSTPAGVTTVLTPGSNGTNQQIMGLSSCLGSAQSSAPGIMGTVSENTGSVPVSTTDFAGCNIQLAVELVTFTAEVVTDQVRLDWTTLTETNNDYFKVERSLDAINFVEIHHEEGAGNSFDRMNYLFIDTNPLEGQSYYRLQMVDINGTKTFSEIRTVRIDDHLDQFSIFPNPVSKGDNLNIVISAHSTSQIEIIVFNVIGREVLSRNQKVTRGSSQITVPTESLTEGIYFVKIDGGNYEMVKKVLVKK
ncbi:MAG: T9SS type A sorting domain-containing protein [Bacteroidota bacterium]